MITNDKYVVHTTFSINMITIDTGNHVLMAAKVELGGGYLGTQHLGFWPLREKIFALLIA